MSRIFKDTYFKLFSVKPWSSFNVSGASQPQKWQWLSSCSASRCPGVRLRTEGQILDSARALVKFDQLADGWGTDSQLQIWILVICYLTFNCFFSSFILSLHFYTLILLWCTASTAIPRVLFRIPGQWGKHWALDSLCPLQHTGNTGTRGRFACFYPPDSSV